MPAGLEVYDASGRIQLRVTDRLSRYVGAYGVNVAGGATVDVSVPGITTDGTWTAFSSSSTMVCEVMDGYVRVHNTYNSNLADTFTYAIVIRY